MIDVTMTMKVKQVPAVKLLVIFLLVFLTIGCGNAEKTATPTPAPVNTVAATAPATEEEPSVSETDDAYPGVDNQQQQTAGYIAPQPTIEGLSPTIPDPEIIFPDTDPDTGVIGGVLAREITDQGYVPVQPHALILGRIIENSKGEQALISVAENAQQAELFATGIFLFRLVPPGDYGLVIDLGFTAFPLLDEDGQQILLKIEGGTIIDLGQIVVDLPED
jgi:hypothetical protein